MINDFHGYLLNISEQPMTAFGGRLIDPTFTPITRSDWAAHAVAELLKPAQGPTDVNYLADAFYGLCRADIFGLQALKALDPRVTPGYPWLSSSRPADVAVTLSRFNGKTLVGIDDRLVAAGVYMNPPVTLSEHVREMMRAPLPHRRLAGAALGVVIDGKNGAAA